MCRARHETETGEGGRLCPSNGGPLPADMDEHERERILQARRAAVRDRVAACYYRQQAQRRQVTNTLRRVPLERREQVIRDMMADPRFTGRGKAGYQKALRAELAAVQRLMRESGL